MFDRKNRPWGTLIIAAGFIFLAHLGLLIGGRPDSEAYVWASDIIPVSADLVAVVALGLASWRLMRCGSVRLSLAWFVIALAQLSTLIADTLWMIYEALLHTSPSPSLADVFYLGFYPLFLIGVMLIPARREATYEWLKTTIDMVIIILAALLASWNFLFVPTILANTENQLLMMINLAYPIGDFLLLMALLMILYRPMGYRRNVPLILLASGLVMIIFFDVLYVYQSAMGTYNTGTVIDLGYTLGNLIIGVAGVHQAWRATSEQNQDVLLEGRSSSKWMIYLPYVWVLGAYALLLARNRVVLPMSMTQISLGVGGIIALVLIRQIIALKENRVLYTRLRTALAQVQIQAVELEQTNKEMESEIRERRMIEARLSYDALHDGLTGLPNRALFLDRLTVAARKKERNPNYQYAVLFLDLDSFKVINDSLGHVTGDQLLIRAGQILQSCVRGSDTVARLGGDEFVILMEDFNTSEDMILTASRLQTELSQPLQLDKTRVLITVSIGIVAQMDGYERPEDVLRDADLAMYQAKAHGKARYEIFDASMRSNIISRMELESDLRRALENHEFILHYQPILELPGQQLLSFEALVRWQHPWRGLISPCDFIPIAEETGLILPIGRWIMAEACRQAVIWRNDTLKRFPKARVPKMSVNISGKQIQQPDFVMMVSSILEDTGLPPELLTLEVTETVCLDNLETVAKTLNELKTLGVETQIDDFGTGYSSLSYLQRLPVHLIKVDRTFIQSISGNNGRMPDVVRAIFSMVNDLGMKAVAEGIENEVQLEALGKMRCDYVQGFLLASPMDQLDVERWMHLNPSSLQYPNK